ncbi:epoxide hydrolase (plasmid) [Agrobacterium vitis]|uniref:alpha/beta fold hydrolase n=1 Tax=Agrobacterium vitis TaxID=373 RepID=UPI0015DA6553|nr:alpha/beta hydrolase [Agrobacterium vitis]BCH67488.1 epoxide hydrolase [Agrobacterium vitis]
MSKIRHAKAHINGVDIHYAEAGEGPLLLLLHGYPEFWYVWRHHLELLSSSFHVVAPDTRGINFSQVVSSVDAYDFDHLVGDVRGLVSHFGAQKAYLAGHDWGGFIAWETAIRHPELVEKLAIVNTAHTGLFEAMMREDGEQARASKYMLAFRSARGEELVSRNDFAGFRGDILDPALAAGEFTAEDVDAYLEAWGRPGTLSAGLNYYRATKYGPVSSDDPPVRALRDTVVKVPTLVLWGERDRYFVPENLDRLSEVVSDLTIKRFPENNHWILHQRPKELAELMGRFFAASPG